MSSLFDTGPAAAKITAILPYFGGKRTIAPAIVKELGKHKDQDEIAADLGRYWCNRVHPEEQNKWTFGIDRMTTARTFLKRLPVTEIYDAIDIAFSRKPPRSNDRDTFKYFCCWSKIKANNPEGQA